MHLRELGHTGRKVSPLGLGLAALGRPGYINLGHSEDLQSDYQVKVMEANTHRMLDLAWDSGICYFDTARSYGKAEDFLASWPKLKKLGPDQVTIGSKWGYYYSGEWKVDANVHEIKDHSAFLLRRQWEESNERLGANLGLYQIHSATNESKVLDNLQVLKYLAGLKEQGISIGLSTSGPDQSKTIRKAINVTISGSRLFDTIQATWNLLEQSATEALSEAHSAGLGIIIKEALANGRLTVKNQDPDFKDKIYLFEFHEKQMDITTDALALATVLNQPWADVVLSGAVTPDQLKSNLNALAVQWNEQIASALSFLREPADQYWKTRSRLVWN